MPKMIKKKEESAVESSKREQVIKAVETIRDYCKSHGDTVRGCKSCLFADECGCSLGNNIPEDWEPPKLAPSREEMKAYVLKYGFLHTFKNGRTTATLYNGNLYLVTRYYKDKDDELVAKYELLKKIFG